jgi:hypothetical protein
MRIVSWNLNHRAAHRRIPSWIVPEIAATSPDVVVCTEYVEGIDHARFCSALVAEGLSCVHTSAATPGQNQILVATRLSARLGNVRAPESIDVSLPSNVLHIDLGGLRIVGFRMPAFKSPKLKRAAWDWIHEATMDFKTVATVIVGDMNTQRSDPKRDCGDCIERFLDSGWSEIIPDTGHSWKHQRSGTERRIDFAFASPGVLKEGASYSWDYVKRNALSELKVGIPDHALLSIDVRVAPVVSQAV